MCYVRAVAGHDMTGHRELGIACIGVTVTRKGNLKAESRI